MRRVKPKTYLLTLEYITNKYGVPRQAVEGLCRYESFGILALYVANRVEELTDIRTTSERLVAVSEELDRDVHVSMVRYFYYKRFYTTKLAPRIERLVLQTVRDNFGDNKFWPDALKYVQRGCIDLTAEYMLRGGRLVKDIAADLLICESTVRVIRSTWVRS